MDFMIVFTPFFLYTMGHPILGVPPNSPYEKKVYTSAAPPVQRALFSGVVPSIVQVPVLEDRPGSNKLLIYPN